MATVPNGSPAARARGRLPVYVFAAAALGALIHALPLVAALATTPDGWHFTGIHQNSPDLMQYRQWFRQTQIDGPVITNVLTPEANRPHLLVLFAWVVGTIAAWLGVSGEAVYAWGGCLLAVWFVVLLYRIVEATVPRPGHRVWIFAALFGGGFGGHLKLLLRFEAVRALPGVRASLYEPLTRYLLFEDFRGHFIFTTFYDSHFLLHWCLACWAVLALLRQIQRPSPARLATVAALFALTTLVHVYSGITIAAVAVCIALTCYVQRVSAATAVRACGAAVFASVVAVGVVALLLSRAGIPISPWRDPVMLPAIVLVAYPLALGFFLWGLPRLLQAPSLETCVLLGWAFGCLAVTFSGPFYAYPDRGVLTLQIPLTILGGLVYFRDRARPTAAAVAVAVFVMAATPAWSVGRVVGSSTFTPESPAKFQNADYQKIVDAARRTASPADLLLADEGSLLWLAPDYPGRNYSAHFFLTVDYTRRQEEVTAFYRGDDVQRAAFLRAQGISQLFVPARYGPDGFAGIAGLRVIEASSVGTLFSFAPPREGATP
ncbi:MAG: hypothetical protein AB7O93_04575 [Vicinamibacterales bacterium]